MGAFANVVRRRNSFDELVADSTAVRACEFSKKLISTTWTQCLLANSRTRKVFPAWRASVTSSACFARVRCHSSNGLAFEHGISYQCVYLVFFNLQTKQIGCFVN